MKIALVLAIAILGLVGALLYGHYTRGLEVWEVVFGTFAVVTLIQGFWFTVPRGRFKLTWRQ